MKRKKKALAKASLKPAASSATTSHLTGLQEFQKAYGSQFLAITQSPAFREAMFLLNRVKLNGLTNLTDEAIEKNGREILADLRGHLKHEDDLLTLHSRTEEFPGEELEEYYSPTQVAELEMLRDKFRKSNQESRYHAS